MCLRSTVYCVPFLYCAAQYLLFTQAPGASEPSRVAPKERAGPSDRNDGDRASSAASAEDGEDAEDWREGAREGGADGKYHPPKLVPMPFEDDTRAGTTGYC